MSSIGKTPSSNEESGWTKYFEEFFSNKNGNNDYDNDEEDHNNNNNNCYSSIMVSDAASSSAPKRLSNYNKKPHEKEFPLKMSFNNNNKNFKTPLLDDDASLQDTATSPLTTSKVLYGNQFEKPKQMEDLKENCSNIEQRDEQKKLLDFNGRYDDGCTSCTELIKEERPLLNINSFVYGSELYYYI
ncbi:hypothetical protein HN51_035436 [Arachis hypogaea]|uniref:Uncharacterized protein n=1 Tax=Arachis hypogaea TaxID=3818 RepID=A0A445A4F8_ARAHY|nr:uncharacterized protein DS421_13g407030 [Arachis hypogaea]RYR21298.1 hypothetical protein Ahy_B03g066590 [Arachis hypogaea]